jgi:hypothetical protein
VAAAEVLHEGVTGGKDPCSGGCDSFQVFAQNRWAPTGTAIREQPNVLSTQVGSFPREHVNLCQRMGQQSSCVPSQHGTRNSGVYRLFARG